MFEAHFDFHGLVRLSLFSTKRAYVEYLDREFAPCAVDPLGSDPPPDIMVYVDVEPGEFGDQNSTMRHFDHRFRKLFRVRYSISDLDTLRTELIFKGDSTVCLYPPIMGTFLQTSVIEPIIYFKCLQQQLMLVHSACVSNGECAYLFVATGGSGKTTTALQLVHYGLKFLSDDLTFVTQDGLALPYPRPLHLFSYVLKGLPFLKLSSKLRLTLLWKDIVRAIISRITGERFYVATRVPLLQVMPKSEFGESAPITKLFLLKKTGKLTRLEPDQLAREQIAQTIAQVGDINQVLCDRLLAGNEDQVVAIQRKEEQVTRSLLSHVSEIYEINPRAFNAADWQQLAMQLRS